MKPQELIEGLRNLAMQAPVNCTLFRVPSAPACHNHEMRNGVTPRDVLDLLEHVDYLQRQHDNAWDAAVERDLNT